MSIFLITNCHCCLSQCFSEVNYDLFFREDQIIVDNTTYRSAILLIFLFLHSVILIVSSSCCSSECTVIDLCVAWNCYTSGEVVWLKYSRSIFAFVNSVSVFIWCTFFSVVQKMTPYQCVELDKSVVFLSSIRFVRFFYWLLNIPATKWISGSDLFTQCNHTETSCRSNLLFQIKLAISPFYFFFFCVPSRARSFSPVSRAKSTVCRSVSNSPQSFLWAFYFFFFCVPSHARSSVQWVRQSLLCRSVSNSPQSFLWAFYFFFVPSHARSSVRWVRWSPLSAAVSQPVSKASCGHPPDWAMSGISKHRRWGRTAGCGWGAEEGRGGWGPVPHGHSSDWEIFSL